MQTREIQPTFWTHRILSHLSPATRLAAVGVLSLSDDEGYFEADAALVRNAIFPFDFDAKNAVMALTELEAVGYIQRRWSAEIHATIGFVVNFTKHQRKGSVLSPLKPSTLKLIYASSPQATAASSEAPKLMAQSPVELIQTKSSTKPELPEGFAEFWELYPRGDGKQNAVKAWSKINPNAELRVKIFENIKSRLSDWERDGGKYVPHAATYLNGRRWEDSGTRIDLTEAVGEQLAEVRRKMRNNLCSPNMVLYRDQATPEMQAEFNSLLDEEARLEAVMKRRVGK